MHSNNPDAYAVWQRVHPSGSPEPQPLQILLQQLQQDQAFLIKRNRREDQPLLQELTTQIHCLKGIVMLSGGTLPRNIPAPPPDHSLRRCYDHTLQRLTAYQLRSSDPVYGPVFRNLAQEAEHHCRLIAERVGRT